MKIHDLNAAQLTASAISRFNMRWSGCEPDANNYQECKTTDEKLEHIKNYSLFAFAKELTDIQAIGVMVWLDLFLAKWGSSSTIWTWAEYLNSRFEDLK